MNDLSNIAYSDEYMNMKKEVIMIAYNPANKAAQREIAGKNLRRIISDYSVHLGDRLYFCSINSVYDKGEFIFEYFNIYRHDFFCEKVRYSDGREYVFYKTDLYGYNVFEIGTKNSFEYFPKRSFGEGSMETFIATDIFFNPNNNTFAVDGCYWACPTDTFLIKIDEPLKPFEKYLNIHLIVDEDYELYDDVCFEGWVDNAVKLRCFSTQEPFCQEIISLDEEVYTAKMLSAKSSPLY
ncbi:MAG: hypothetical protein LBP51_07100 [Deferribacteraceae bacterium]|jgi:hypothetical protein|nr:hypothetical protein [Deferribacteraceae bacterium]